jgi:hypothetical protein
MTEQNKEQKEQEIDLSQLVYYVSGREFMLNTDQKLKERIELASISKKMALANSEMTVNMTADELCRFFSLILKPTDGQLTALSFFLEIDEQTQAEVTALFFIIKGLKSQASEKKLISQVPELQRLSAKFNLSPQFTQSKQNVN